MGRINWTNKQIKEIIKKYQRGIGMNTIAKYFDCSPNAIKTVLKNNNIKIRTISEANGGEKISQEIAEKIIYNYVILGQGLATCGKEYGLSQFHSTKLLKEYGVKLRTYVEAKDCLRKYSIDDNFFKHQNHDMAYILGFIAADGNVAKKENCISIEVHEKDKELLEDIKRITKSDRELKFYIHKRDFGEDTPTCKFQVWSLKWKKDLAVYNIVPNKTLTLKPPYFLDEEYQISFIKGYFDGDGSIYSDKNNKRKTVSIGGASKEMIEWIRDIFANKYGIIGSYIKEKTSSGLPYYKLLYSSKNAVKEIYNLWYIKDSSSIYLNRKKKRFE